ncbi:hypothetical protein [Nonomuraea sp. MG754425]|uniref:hypothetical protein n=1 Tax=Nonomuraea sp. MG754425 TaxID=2570319 RepID=UPI001F367C49|nr:hypothetical protein [Nonomuraea sp. MG754425]
MARTADLLAEPWDARMIGEDDRFRRAVFGGRGLVSFFVDESAHALRIFDVTWAG